jgi:hypothetical protein
MNFRLALLAALGALAAAGPAGAVSDTLGGATFHPFTMPGNTGCVAWDEPGEGRTYNCDPVNVVFPNQSLTQVRDRLRGRGWTTSGLGSNQYLHFATPTLVRQQLQLFRSDGFVRQYQRPPLADGHDNARRRPPRERHLPAHDRQVVGRL